MHHLDPVSQRIHDQPQREGAVQVQHVAGACIVDIEPPILGQAVIGRVVQPAERQGRAQFVPFGGVVVDDIQDHLDPGLVEPCDHLLEFGDVARLHVARFRREEPIGHVAPEIRQLPVGQKAVVGKGMNGQQLDRGDAKPRQVIQDGFGRHRQIAAAMPDIGAPRGQSLDMRLIDHRFGQGTVQGTVVAPGEAGVHDHRLRHVLRAVAAVEGQVGIVMPDPVSHQRVMRGGPSRQPLGIGVDQQLARVEAMPFVGAIGAVHPKAVFLAWAQPLDMAVPDMALAFGQIDPRLSVAFVEQAQHGAFGMLRKHRKVHPRAVEGRTQGRGAPCGHRDGLGHDGWVSLA